MSTILNFYSESSWVGTVTARVLPHILFNIVINIGTSPAVEVQVCRGRGRRYGRRGGSLTRRVTGPGWGSPGRGVHRDSDGALLVVLLVSRTPATITVHYNHGAGSERAGRGSESVAKPQWSGEHRAGWRNTSHGPWATGPGPKIRSN